MQPSPEYGVFPRMVEIMLPRGGVCVALVEAYFDESYGTAKTQDGRKAGILCVTGYIIESGQARALCDDWRAVLEPHGLPFFHMVDCAHGNEEFKPLRDQPKVRSLIASQMIGNIKRRTIRGIGVSIGTEVFDKLAPRHPVIGSAYSLCLTTILSGVEKWIRETKYQGDVAYFFEAGHDSQKEANWILDQTFNQPDMKKQFHYVGHAFLEKAHSPPTQAADLLAWQYYTSIRRRLEGKADHRQDFASLIAHPHDMHFIKPEQLKEVAAEPIFSSEWAKIVRDAKAELANAIKDKPAPAIPSYAKGEPQS